MPPSFYGKRLRISEKDSCIVKNIPQLVRQFVYDHPVKGFASAGNTFC